MMTSKTLLAAVAGCCILGAAHAQEPAADKASSTGEGITLELNKLETSDKGCRAYVVVTNATQTAFDAYKLDLVLFRKDGVIIGRQIALNLAPIRPDKKSVKVFGLEAQCDEIGTFMVNDVLECKSPSGPVDNCLAQLNVKSLTNVQITK